MAAAAHQRTACDTGYPYRRASSAANLLSGRTSNRSGPDDCNVSINGAISSHFAAMSSARIDIRPTVAAPPGPYRRSLDCQVCGSTVVFVTELDYDEMVVTAADYWSARLPGRARWAIASTVLT